MSLTYRVLEVKNCWAFMEIVCKNSVDMNKNNEIF